MKKEKQPTTTPISEEEWMPGQPPSNPPNKGSAGKKIDETQIATIVEKRVKEELQGWLPEIRHLQNQLKREQDAREDLKKRVYELSERVRGAEARLNQRITTLAEQIREKA